MNPPDKYSVRVSRHQQPNVDFSFETWSVFIQCAHETRIHSQSFRLDRGALEIGAGRAEMHDLVKRIHAWATSVLFAHQWKEVERILEREFTKCMDSLFGELRQIKRNRERTEKVAADIAADVAERVRHTTPYAPRPGVKVKPIIKPNHKPKYRLDDPELDPLGVMLGDNEEDKKQLMQLIGL